MIGVKPEACGDLGGEIIEDVFELKGCASDKPYPQIPVALYEDTPGDSARERPNATQCAVVRKAHEEVCDYRMSERWSFQQKVYLVRVQMVCREQHMLLNAV